MNFSEILNRQQLEKEISTILLNFQNSCQDLSFKKGIYIYGSPGSGKTYFIEQIIKKLDFDVIKYDAGDVRNKSLIDTITSNNISNQNVLDMMKGKKRKIVIIMDEIDGMNNGDKGGINALIKLIRQKKTKKQKLESYTLNPVICIGTYYVDKKIKELMKVCHSFELKSPNQIQMENLISAILPKQKFTNKELILNYIQQDLRKLIFIQNTFDKKIISEDSLLDIFHLKSCNEDSKQITKTLFSNYIPFNDHNRKLNDNDRTIVALLYHENSIDVLEKNCTGKNKITLYLKLLKNICFADYFDRITFQNQIWIFNEMSSLIKTFYNNYLLHQELPNLSFNDEIRFTKVLTKYSTEYNNILFINHLCFQLNMDKKDVFAFFQELRWKHKDSDDFLQLFETNNKLNLLFDGYEISTLDIKRIYRFLDKVVKKEQEIVE